MTALWIRGARFTHAWMRGSIGSKEDKGDRKEAVQHEHVLTAGYR
jgi:hypothetical protein